MTISVHDNWVYAHSVDHQLCRIVLHTVYPHVHPAEYTDIVFGEVVVHHFEQQQVGLGTDPSNVLFDVEESSPIFELTQIAALLSRTKRYGWPVANYVDIDDLAERLTADGAKCFSIHGTCGLSGFVFAKSVEFPSRESRAELGW